MRYALPLLVALLVSAGARADEPREDESKAVVVPVARQPEAKAVEAPASRTEAPIVATPEPPTPVPTNAEVRPQPVPEPEPAEQEQIRRTGKMVFLRTNPLAIAIHGRPLGGDTSAWHPDLVAMGFGGQKLEFIFSMTAQNVVPGPDEKGTIYGQLSALYRPIRLAGVPAVDPYVYAGGGLGGGGVWEQADSNCDSDCGRRWSQWAAEAHVGVGIDLNLPVLRFASGQSMYLSVGADIRAVSFFNGDPNRFFNVFVVYSLPVTLRWD